MKLVFLNLMTLSCFLFLIGCSGSSTRKEGKVVKGAFEALKKNDIEAFQAISITGSDFVLKAGKVNKIAQKNSYVGGVHKKLEQDHAAMQFNLARECWEGYIDYNDPDVKCVGLGRLLWEGDVPHLNGVDIPARIYSAKVKNKEGEHEDIPPYFQIVEWGSEFRIMGMKFPHQNAEDAAGVAPGP